MICSLATVLDSGTLVTVGTAIGAMLLVAGIAWRAASMKGEFAKEVELLRNDLTNLKEAVSGTLSTQGQNINTLFAKQAETNRTLGKLEGRMNGKD